MMYEKETIFYLGARFPLLGSIIELFFQPVYSHLLIALSSFWTQNSSPTRFFFLFISFYCHFSNNMIILFGPSYRIPSSLYRSPYPFHGPSLSSNINSYIKKIAHLCFESSLKYLMYIRLTRSKVIYMQHHNKLSV